MIIVAYEYMFVLNLLSGKLYIINPDNKNIRTINRKFEFCTVLKMYKTITTKLL